MVRTFQSYFPKKHPREGQPTYFVEKIISGDKIHTFRKGYSFKDGAVLSRRTWSDKPYNSKQNQFIADTIGYTQNFVIIVTKKYFEVYAWSGNEFRKLDENLVSANDGLSLEDFKAWFPKTVQGQIIHWTDLRY